MRKTTAESIRFQLVSAIIKDGQPGAYGPISMFFIYLCYSLNNFFVIVDNNIIVQISSPTAHLTQAG